MGLISMNMEEKILQIPIEDIIPNRFQPRLTFDDQALQELAASIKEHGIIQPLVLRKLGDKYEIVAGERRYKASQIAGLTTVPAVISNIDDDKSAEVALIENIQRKNLTSIEEARSYKNLLDRGYSTQEQLAEKLGVSQSTIANKLRLLNLADEVQDALLNEKISERHARSLLSIKDNDEQVKWLNKILNERLTVRQLDVELKKSLNNADDEEDAAIPIVELTPNIDEIKSNALDINPTQGLHDIESMLKPSMPGEKTFDLSIPIENVETLDFDEEIITETPKVEEKTQNKFFNFLEDEVANMNAEESIDDIFNVQPIEIKLENDNQNNITEIPVEQQTLEVPTIEPINVEIPTLEIENTITSTTDMNNNESIDTVLKPVNNIIEPTIIQDDNTVTNSFFTFGNNNDLSEEPTIPVIEPVIPNVTVENNNNIEENNIIETVSEIKVDDVFDPMSMVNTLEPDYQAPTTVESDVYEEFVEIPG